MVEEPAALVARIATVATGLPMIFLGFWSPRRGSDQWIDQARKHAGQLRLYGNAIVAALPAPKPIVLALHLPISGEALVVE